MSDIYTDLKETPVINHTLDSESIVRAVGKLDIQPDTVLILRMEKNVDSQEIIMVRRILRKILSEKYSFEIMVLIFVGDTELATTSRENLTRLRDDIDKILKRTDTDNETESSGG